MNKTTNTFTITGTLVKNNLERFINKNGDDAIKGTIIIRTKDGSEHEVNAYANKYKKGTNEITRGYTSYENLIENAKDMSQVSEGESAAVVSVNGRFEGNDYLTRDGRIYNGTRLSIWSVDVIRDSEVDKYLQEATFEIDGVIESMEDEVRNNELTGEYVVKLNCISQKVSEDGKTFSADAIFPITFKIKNDLIEGFKSIGYYEGCFSKFAGQLINTVTVETVVEKAAFGADRTKQITKYNRCYQINSGDAPKSPDEVGLSYDVLTMLKEKRRTMLAELANGNKPTGFPTPTTTQTPPPPVRNPFAAMAN